MSDIIFIFVDLISGSENLLIEDNKGFCTFVWIVFGVIYFSFLLEFYTKRMPTYAKTLVKICSILTFILTGWFVHIILLSILCLSGVYWLDNAKTEFIKFKKEKNYE